MKVQGAVPSYKIISLQRSAALVSFFSTGKKRISWHGGLPGISNGHLYVTAIQFIVFNFANYSPSIAMELKVSKEITCK